MFNAIFQTIAVNQASFLLTQAFVSRLVALCQQALYSPYNRDAIYAQIKADIQNAFASTPASGHEQLASNILSMLANFPVSSFQLRLLGPQECARRYPLYTPIIYSIADVLMPGWNQPQIPSFTSPHPATQWTPQYTSSPFSQLYSPSQAPSYYQPSSPLYVPPAPAPTPVTPARETDPRPWQPPPASPSRRPERPAKPSPAKPTKPAFLSPSLKDSKPPPKSKSPNPPPKSNPPIATRPVPPPPNSPPHQPKFEFNMADLQADMARYAAMSPEDKARHRNKMLAANVDGGRRADAKADELRDIMHGLEARLAASSSSSSAGDQLSPAERQSIAARIAGMKKVLGEDAEARRARDYIMGAAPGVYAADMDVADFADPVGALWNAGGGGAGGDPAELGLTPELAEQFAGLVLKAGKKKEREREARQDGNKYERDTPDCDEREPAEQNAGDHHDGLRDGERDGRQRRGSDDGNGGGQDPLQSEREGLAVLSSIPLHVARLRSDRLSCRWDSSAQYTATLTAVEKAHPDVALEIGMTLFKQGWVRKARDAADVAWRQWKDTWRDKPAIDALRLLIVFLEFLCDDRLKEAMAEALAVREIGQRVGDVEHWSNAQVIAEMMHFKIMDQAMYEGLLEEDEFRPILVQRLEKLTRRLQRAGRFQDAVFFALLLSDQVAPDRGEEMLLEFLRRTSSDQLPPINRGEVYLELAGLVGSGSRTSLAAEDYVALAAAEFDKAWLQEGRLKVTLQRLQLARPQTPAQVGEILAVADSFASLSQRFGEILALTYATRAALQLYNKVDFWAIYDRSKRLCDEAGYKFLLLQNFCTAASILIKRRPEHIGKTTETLLRLVESTSDDLPRTKGQLARFLAKAFLQLGDREKSLRHARLAVGLLRSSGQGNHLLLSKATRTLAAAVSSDETHDSYREAIEILEGLVELDARYQNGKGQLKACEALADLEGQLAKEGDDTTGRHLRRRNYWDAQTRKSSLEAARGQYSRTMREHVTMKEFKQGEIVARAALRRFAAEGDARNVAECHWRLFQCLYHPFDFSLPPSEAQSEEVDEILLRARKAMQAYLDLGPGEAELGLIVEIVTAFGEVARYDPTRASELYPEGLTFLEIGESVCDSMRRDLPSLSGLPDLLQKRILVGYKYHREIYAQALKITAALEDPEQLWKWTQKSKAKALSDMVASKLVSPGQVPIEEIADEQAIQLLAEEARLLRTLESATVFEIIEIRRRLEGLRERMKGQSALGHLLASRGGTVELDDLGWIFDSGIVRSPPGSRGKVVLVDWVVVGDAIFMLTVESSLVPRMTALDVTLQQVRDWKGNNLAMKEPLSDKFTYRSQLRAIQGLVAPLKDLTAPGDFLVLCPSADLHAIPLHALNVIGDQALIQRNYLIYTTSLSLLRISCTRAMAKRRSQPGLGSPRTAFFANFEGVAGNSRIVRESPKVYASVTSLAAEFGSLPSLRSDASRDKFEESAHDVDILHFHGHMNYHAQDVLQQSLGLSKGNTDDDTTVSKHATSPLPQDQEGLGRHEGGLTVGEIFSLHMNASLATMIACSSGVQDVSAGDEPLGLLAALLYAGCATVVGSLWPVNSPDGRFLSLQFYKKLREASSSIIHRQQGGQGGGVEAAAAAAAAHREPPLNLAVCFCEAVRELKDDFDPDEDRDQEELPWHWAPFVMHGAWFL